MAPVGATLVPLRVHPVSLIPEGMRVLLGGTPYWMMPKRFRAGRQMMVSAFQWEMYRVHQVWARPFWCMQGNDGGSPASYSELEEALLRAKGMDSETADPGTLPYAPFDQRSITAIRGRDRLWKQQQNLNRLRASGDNEAMKAESKAAEEAFRTEFWSWWSTQMQPQAEFWSWYSAKEEAQHVSRRQTMAEARAADAAEESYITTGIVPRPVSHESDT